MDIKEHDQLLKEYELCQEHTEHLDKNIWTTSGFIGLGSIGSLLLSDYKTGSLLSITIIASLVVATVWIWWKMANRWWSIQHSIFHRMKDIEKEIHLYQTRYVAFLDDPKRDKTILNGLPEDKIKTLSEAFPTSFYRGQVQGAIKWLPWLITIIWVLYLAIRIIISRKDSLMQVIGSISLTWLGLLIILGSIFMGGVGIGLIIGWLIGKSKSQKSA